MWKLLKENKLYLLIIFLVSFVIICPLLFSNQFTWTHDGLYHYINISAMNSNIDLSSFKFFADKVIGTIAYGFGWGSGIFYPSFAYYLAVYLFKFLNVFGVSSIFTILKICDFLAILFAGIFMFLFCKKLLKNNVAALVSSIIYMTFPYFFIDVFVRGALAEMFLFMFVPIVFLGLEYLFEENYRYFYLFFIVGYVGSINCHLVLSVYLTIFVILFLLLNFNKIWNKKIIFSLCISALIILALCAPFVVPLLQHTLNGDYTIYIDGLSYTIDNVLNTTIELGDYFSLNKPLAWTGEITFTISITAFICFVYTLINFRKIPKGSTLRVYLILVFVTIFMLSPIFPWKYVPGILLNIQFVWRLELFLAFFMCIGAGYMFIIIKPRLAKILSILIIVISLVWMFSFNKMVIMQSYNENEIDLVRQGPATLFYIPAASYRNLDYVQNRSDDVIVKKGKADIYDVIDNTPYLEFNVETEGATLELPRYYFFGYDVTLNGKKINYIENQMGFMQINVKEGGRIIVKYTGGISYKISIFIQIGTIIFCVLYLIKARRVESSG